MYVDYVSTSVFNFAIRKSVRTVVHCCADNCSTPVVCELHELVNMCSIRVNSYMIWFTLQCIQYTDMVIFGVLVGE